MLQFIEGFDTYGTSNGTAAPTGVMQRRGWASAGSLQAGRVSGKSLSIGSTANNQIQFASDTVTTKTIGIGVWRSNNNFNTVICTFRETSSSTPHIAVRINDSGLLQVYAANTLHATGSTALNINQWYYVELTFTVHNSTGSYTLKLNGVNELTASGIDTQGSTNGYVRWLDFGYTSGSGWSPDTLRLDDIYITDNTGSHNTGFLGQCVVEVIYPDGDATPNDFAPNSGTSHFDRVNQAQTDDDTTYLEDNVSGQREMFTYGAIATTGAIYGVQAVAGVRVTDGSSVGLNSVISSDGTTVVGSTHTISGTSYGRVVDLYETDPDTSDLWLQAALNLATFGFEID